MKAFGKCIDSLKEEEGKKEDYIPENPKSIGDIEIISISERSDDGQKGKVPENKGKSLSLATVPFEIRLNQCNLFESFKNLEAIPILRFEIQENAEERKKKGIEEKDKSKEIVVFKSKTGACYHRESCHFLRKSRISVPLSAAKRHLNACRKCIPT